MKTTEDEIVELTVELESLGHELNAKSLILELLKSELTDSQRKKLEQAYARSRQQHLNDFDLEEEQAEALEALCNELEAFLAK